MLIFRDMTAEEFPAYSKYFIADYGQEIANNYGHPLDVALKLAKKDLTSSFPDGLNTRHHQLLCIEIESEIDRKISLVGYLWLSKNITDNSTFIYDFYVLEPYQNKGIGKQAIKQLEEQLTKENIHQINLRVAYQNKRALKLYQDAGFTITGYNMTKII